jgi:hypothetical protein
LNPTPSGPPPRRPTLELERGGERVVLELLGRSTVLGSSAEADLSLALPGVAARHARFEREGERLFAVALDPAHPLRVQGVERKEWLLRDGDAVELGELRLVFRWAEARAEAAPAVSSPTPSALAVPAAAPAAALRPAPALAPLAPPFAPRPRRDEGELAPRERRAAPASGWPLPAKAFLVLLVLSGLWILWRATREAPSEPLPAPSKAYQSTDGLEPFFYYAIYPLSERLDDYPDAARLVALRCEALLLECADPRTRVFAERALARARARLGGSSWTFAEMRFATEQAPSGGRSEDYFRREKLAILDSFLATNPGGADRFVAEAKRKQLTGPP